MVRQIDYLVGLISNPPLIDSNDFPWVAKYHTVTTTTIFTPTFWSGCDILPCSLSGEVKNFYKQLIIERFLSHHVPSSQSCIFDPSCLNITSTDKYNYLLINCSRSAMTLAQFAVKKHSSSKGVQNGCAGQTTSYYFNGRFQSLCTKYYINRLPFHLPAMTTKL